MYIWDREASIVLIRVGNRFVFIVVCVSGEQGWQWLSSQLSGSGHVWWVLHTHQRPRDHAPSKGHALYDGSPSTNEPPRGQQIRGTCIYLSVYSLVIKLTLPLFHFLRCKIRTIIQLWNGRWKSFWRYSPNYAFSLCMLGFWIVKRFWIVLCQHQSSNERRWRHTRWRNRHTSSTDKIGRD